MDRENKATIWRHCKEGQDVDKVVPTVVELLTGIGDDDARQPGITVVKGSGDTIEVSCHHLHFRSVYSHVIVKDTDARSVLGSFAFYKLENEAISGEPVYVLYVDALGNGALLGDPRSRSHSLVTQVAEDQSDAREAFKLELAHAIDGMLLRV